MDDERGETVPPFEVFSKAPTCIEGGAVEVGVVGDVDMRCTGRDRCGDRLAVDEVEGGDAAPGGVSPWCTLDDVTADDFDRGPMVVIQTNLGPFRPPDNRQTGDRANRLGSGNLGGVDLFGHFSPRCPVDRRRISVYVGVG